MILTTFEWIITGFLVFFLLIILIAVLAIYIYGIPKITEQLASISKCLSYITLTFQQKAEQARQSVVNRVNPAYQSVRNINAVNQNIVQPLYRRVTAPTVPVEKGEVPLD